jgi:hypothetical protein
VPVSYLRRLVLEKRVTYHKIGKYVRLSPADLDALVHAVRVEAVTSSSRSQQIPDIPRFGRASQHSTRSNKKKP